MDPSLNLTRGSGDEISTRGTSAKCRIAWSFRGALVHSLLLSATLLRCRKESGYLLREHDRPPAPSLSLALSLSCRVELFGQWISYDKELNDVSEDAREDRAGGSRLGRRERCNATVKRAARIDGCENGHENGCESLRASSSAVCEYSCE